MAGLINTAVIITRYVLALIFFVAGASMIDQYAFAYAFMVSMGLPGQLLPLIIAVQIGGAFSLLSGIKLRWAAYTLALLSVGAALLLHHNFDEPVQGLLFIRNLAVAAALLLIAAHRTEHRDTSKCALMRRICHAN